MDQTNAKRIIEAALFMSSKAVKIEDLAKIADTNIAQVRVAINELIHDFEAKDTALKIVDTGTGIKMDVKDEFKESVSALAAAPEFNKSIMKTLAHISYRQPVKQTEVIKFRNNKAYDHIKVLEENGFIRREQTGKSYVIYTTKKFLEYFGDQQKKQN